MDQGEKKNGGCFTLVLAILVVLFFFSIVNSNKTKTSIDPAQKEAKSAYATLETAPPGSAKEAVQKGELTMSDIKHRADALGWSTTAWQEWYYVASQTGTSMESIEEAAAELNRRVAAGGQEIEASLQAIGISLEDARAMEPEELFEKLIYGLQSLGE